MQPDDILRAMQEMEGRITTRIDRIAENAVRREDLMRENMDATNEKVAKVRSEFDKHQGKMAAIATGVGFVVSAAVALLSKLIPNSGGH